MDLGLTDRVALVTGATGGIGRATAVALGREGMRVALTWANDEPAAAATADAVRAAGGEALALPLRLEDHGSIDAAVAAVRERWGGLDVLVANAVHWGSRPDGRPEEQPPGAWQASLRANLEGAFATVRAALPAMRGRGDGRIVLISSGIAEEGMAGSWAYGAAKAGLHGMARSLAWDLGPEGILVNVLGTGFTRTERNGAMAEILDRAAAATPTRRLSTPDDVATVIAFLASRANRSVTGEVVREGSSTARSFAGAM